MDTSPHDFVTVDMRGLKAALLAHARAKRLSVSVVVRDAVACVLAQVGGDQPVPAEPDECANAGPWTKLSIRFTRSEAACLSTRARAAGLSRGAYLAGLAAGVPVLGSGGSRPEVISALVASCAELSTISRNVHQLTWLLRGGDVQRALEYRAMLDGLADVVRGHLTLAAGVLAELQPRLSRGDSNADRSKDRRRPWRKA